MNSAISKRYLIDRKPDVLTCTDWKVLDLSNGNKIFACDEQRALTVAYAYNQYYCKPDKQLKYFVMNFISLFESIQKTNGASYNLHTSKLNPESGYMVAFPGFEKIVDIPHDLTDFMSVVTAYCINKEMWDKISSNPSNIYLGFWINEGKLYIDLSENIDTFGVAYHLASIRNQVALYDCKNKKDVKVIVNTYATTFNDLFDAPIDASEIL